MASCFQIGFLVRVDLFSWVVLGKLSVGSRMRALDGSMDTRYVSPPWPALFSTHCGVSTRCSHFWGQIDFFIDINASRPSNPIIINGWAPNAEAVCYGALFWIGNRVAVYFFRSTTTCTDSALGSQKWTLRFISDSVILLWPIYDLDIEHT